MPDRFTWSIVVLKKEILITLEGSEQWFEELIWSAWAVLVLFTSIVVLKIEQLFLCRHSWFGVLIHIFCHCETNFSPENVLLLRTKLIRLKKFSVTGPLCHSVCFVCFRFYNCQQVGLKKNSGDL